MLKFIRGKGQQPSAERQKLQQELFAFRKTVQHGFPHGACALSWDPFLRLMAIGTSSGAVKIYGAPGVELYGQHSEATLTNLYFINGTGRIISLCEDNSLHLWEITENSLVQIKNFTLEGKQKGISCVCVEASGEKALLGTEGGNVYTLDLETFTCTDEVIYLEKVMQNCPEHFKLSPGSIELVAQQPGGGRRVVLGYQRGLLVIWNRDLASPTHTFVSGQQLESLCWSRDGLQLITSHNDGSYVTWDIDDGTLTAEASRKEPLTPYGPYACKAITKILHRTSIEGEEIIIYAGGMPRASYGDKHTVTVLQGTKQVAFDFTSRVIDMFTTGPKQSEGWRETRPHSASDAHSVSQIAETLIVLADEELVAIDLRSSAWKPLRLPYLVSIHASAVTAVHLVDHVDEKVYSTIYEAGLRQTENMYSTNPWPVDGGETGESPENGNTSSENSGSSQQLLLTGHEDGSVRFWDVTTVTMKPLNSFTTAELFSGEEVPEGEKEAGADGDQVEEEEWPPFRRVGTFDPYSDDPRLALKKVWLCGLSGQLVVAGAAGHIVVAQLNSTSSTAEIKSVAVNIVSDRDGFVWKGHDKLPLRQGLVNFAPGFQAASCIQLHPPAAITALSVQPEWGVLAAGSAHGLALLDTRQDSLVLHKCTLHPHDGIGTGEVISRRKSFKKSLRESFRRLRKGRSQRRRTTVAEQTPAAKKADSIEAEAKPVERPIEARPADDGLGSMLRSLYFARAYLINAQATTPTLWAGTNNGTVYAFTISIPSNNKRKEELVTCQLAKEIQLKHRAPVVGISILDAASVPLPHPLEVERGVTPLPDTAGPQRVLLASEEQFKLFTLPSLKPYCKYKLTAHEGARVRKVAFGWFAHGYCCLLCLTNLGDCLVLALPELRRLLNAAAVRKEDINGISSLVFSRQGEALYLLSSSELQRITVSATKVTKPKCHIKIASWAQRDESASAKQAETVPGEEVQAHDVTAASADITIDSVRDHTNQQESNINLQNVTVNESSMVVKTTTRSPPPQDGAAGDHVLEHSREEGIITRVESGTVTVPAGTDPKLILEMLDRSRTPLAPPTPTPH